MMLFESTESSNLKLRTQVFLDYSWEFYFWFLKSVYILSAVRTMCRHTAQHQSLRMIALDCCILHIHIHQPIDIVLVLLDLYNHRLRRVLLDVLLCKGNKLNQIIISLNSMVFHLRCNCMVFLDNKRLHLYFFVNLTSNLV